MPEPNEITEQKADQPKEELDIELEKVDYADLACNMALVLNNLGEVDLEMFDESEKTQIKKTKLKALKLLCRAMTELDKEYYPKKYNKKQVENE